LGYAYQVSRLKGKAAAAAYKAMPRVHRVAALTKCWLLGTHQGAVRPPHLPYYLDEFTFRFNRPRSHSRGKLFYQLLPQAADPNALTRHPWPHAWTLCSPTDRPRTGPPCLHRGWGYTSRLPPAAAFGRLRQLQQRGA